MTAGFNDGRPPRLARRPGSDSQYSNDTANMLAELLTRLFRQDLALVMKRRVMDPIGVPPSEWRWRANQYRPKTDPGLHPRCESPFESGKREVAVGAAAKCQLG